MQAHLGGVMLTILFTFVASMLYVAFKYPRPIKSIRAKIYTGLVFSIIPVGLAGFFAMMPGLLLDHSYTTISTVPIYPWRDEGGERYLSVNVGRDTYYLFLEKVDGSYNYEMITGDVYTEVDILEEDRNDAVIESQDRYITNPLVRPFVLNMVHQRYLIRIPKGTVAP